MKPYEPSRRGRSATSQLKSMSVVALIISHMMNSRILAMDTSEPIESRGGRRVRWPPFHWLESPEIKPIVEDFWRARYDEDDLAMYNRFIEILRLYRNGLNGESISRSLDINNVGKYITGNKMSFLTRLRGEHDRLGPPKPAHKWLPLRLKPRGTPDTAWVEVPTPTIRFGDIQSFIERITPTLVEPRLLTNFGFSSHRELESERTNLFGFLLGAIVGDSGKHSKGTTRFYSRSLSLVLSKNKPNSYRFGEFVSLCGNASLGIGMHRVHDLPVSDKRYGKTECYCWISSSSPLVSWVFNECLGLRDDETTTYDPLRMGWLLKTSRDFKIHFIQGLAESDGWPDASDDQVKLVSSPNTEFFKKLMEGLGCHPNKADQPLVQLLRCSTQDAFKLPFFSPRIASNLYQDMQTLAIAKRYPERIRLPQGAIETIRELSRAALSASEVCLRLAEKTGFKVSGHTVKKYAET